MRAVLDTNTLVSALLFSGTAARLVPLWQSGRLHLRLSRPILQEYLRVLAYPKFRLTPEDIRGLLDEVLPLVECAGCESASRPCAAIRPTTNSSSARWQAAWRTSFTGDRDLRTLGSYRRIAIVTPAEFLDQIEE